MNVLLVFWLFASSAMLVFFSNKVYEVSGYHVHHGDHDYHHDYHDYQDDHGYHGYHDYPDHHEHHDHHDYHHHDYHHYDTANDHGYGYGYDHDHHHAPTDKKKICSSDTCQNGGTCVAEGYNFVCNCTCDYHGKYCQKKTNPCVVANPCKNGGTCSHTNVNGTCQTNCACACGYEGPNCTEVTNPCIVANPCKNGGTCSHTNANGTCQTKCACTCNFKGPNCAEEIDFCKDCVRPYFCVNESCGSQCILGCNLTANSLQTIQNLSETLGAAPTNVALFKLWAYFFQTSGSNCTQWCVKFAEFFFAIIPVRQDKLGFLLEGRFDDYRNFIEIFPNEQKAKILPVFDQMRVDCQGQPPEQQPPEPVPAAPPIG